MGALTEKPALNLSYEFKTANRPPPNGEHRHFLAHQIDPWPRTRLGRGQVQELTGCLVHPGQRIALERSRVLAESRALDAAVKAYRRERRRGLDHLAALLNGFSYQRVLELGFALVHDRTGQAVVTVKALQPGMGLGLRFYDGETAVTVDGTGTPRKRSASKAGKPDDGQGTLL